MALNHSCFRVRAAEKAPRGPVRLPECRRGLAEVVERRTGVREERVRVKRPYLEREGITLFENASRHGNRSPQQRLGFLEVVYCKKAPREGLS